MFRIKKQINTLYITSILGNLSITGAWVAILASRGFSLVQIGFAETIFHITSLIFEIPSGVLADVYGRKKMLIVSNLCGVIADIVMAFSNGFVMVCISIATHALAYNFASGSADALAYDSLKTVGEEKRYERYFSNQSIIYRVATGISTMCAGIALLLGYRISYLISAATCFVTLLITFTLVEVDATPIGSGEQNKDAKDSKVIKTVMKKMGGYFGESIRFLIDNRKATKLMFANSFVGAIDILLLFFLQSKLDTAGISNTLLGLALFVMQIGGVIGAKLILKAKHVKYAKIFIICTFGVLSGVLMEHTASVMFMVLGGFIAAMADDALQIRTDAKLQDMFPSQQRATLISISSFTFSVIMIVLSPLAGYFFTIW
ncbi:MAG: MFS transporter [Lachnospiraceae bacterium]|nr:MFS transporter [Lachnospiraceae bacterium]